MRRLAGASARRFPSATHCDIAPGVGPGFAAQVRGTPGERLVELALGRPLEDPGDLGQRVGPARRERAQLGYCWGFLFPGERAPLSVMPGLASQFGDEQPVRVVSEMILVHSSRIELECFKGNLNSVNRTGSIRRVLKCR